MTNEEPDIVDHALVELLATPGPEKPPIEVVERALNALRIHQVAPHMQRSSHLSFRQQIAWLPLAACVLVMVTGSWVAAFHATLWRHVAAQRVNSDGTVWVHYTDGRVIPDSNT